MARRTGGAGVDAESRYRVEVLPTATRDDLLTGREVADIGQCGPTSFTTGNLANFLRGKAAKIYSLPSYLNGHVAGSLACPRVMAAPENIKAGFLKEKDAFAEHDVRYAAPLVSFADPPVVPKQLFEGLRDFIPGLMLAETRGAVDVGFRALESYAVRLRARARQVLEECARRSKPALLVLARPYHMDPGIGHEIEVDLQAYGYPVLWTPAPADRS